MEILSQIHLRTYQICQRIGILFQFYIRRRDLKDAQKKYPQFLHSRFFPFPYSSKGGSLCVFYLRARAFAHEQKGRHIRMFEPPETLFCIS